MSLLLQMMKQKHVLRLLSFSFYQIYFPPKGIHVLIPRICEHASLRGKWNFADVIELKETEKLPWITEMCSIESCGSSESEKLLQLWSREIGLWKNEQWNTMSLVPKMQGGTQGPGRRQPL